MEFVQQLFRFVDLCGEVRATSSVGVIQKHGGSVGLADLVLSDGTLAGSYVNNRPRSTPQNITYLSDRIKVASFLVILGSKPPL